MSCSNDPQIVNRGGKVEWLGKNPDHDIFSLTETTFSRGNIAELMIQEMNSDGSQGKWIASHIDFKTAYGLARALDVLLKHNPHPCDRGTLRYRAEFGAPGFGQSWECSVCERGWAKIGPGDTMQEDFVPIEQGAHIMDPEQLR